MTGVPGAGPDEVPGAVALLDREARALVVRLRVWTPVRWAAASPYDGLTRADVAHHLATVLAEAGGAPAPLPRLSSDLALPDQLAVTAHDLVQSAPDDEQARTLTAHLLLHRSELLGDDVPTGLAQALQLDDVLATAQATCELHP